MTTPLQRFEAKLEKEEQRLWEPFNGVFIDARLARQLVDLVKAMDAYPYCPYCGRLSWFAERHGHAEYCKDAEPVASREEDANGNLSRFNVPTRPG